MADGVDALGNTEYLSLDSIAVVVHAGGRDDRSGSVQGTGRRVGNFSAAQYI